MIVAAVTGTNGKTSTVEFARQLLARSGVDAASYGTLGLVTAEGRDPDPPITIGPKAMPSFVRRLDCRGTDALALEAYSSSLDTGLLDGVAADVAGFTNLDRDHLDHHGTLEAYFRAKRRLFETVLDADGTAVLNADVPEVKDLRATCRERGVEVRTYGRAASADLRLRETEPLPDGTRATLVTDAGRHRVDLPVVGDAMVENVLCALGMAIAAGTSASAALEHLEALRQPPGRFERVAGHGGASVYVDYAHTPSALDALLDSLAPRANGDLVLAFGCGGGCDRGKRREMGEIAAAGADRVFVTDDNPREEEPSAIRADVLAGCPDAVEVAGRERAIRRAMDSLRAGDVLVVAGKGHEQYQDLGGEKRRFSDHEVIRRLADGTGDVATLAYDSAT